MKKYAIRLKSLFTNLSSRFTYKYPHNELAIYYVVAIGDYFYSNKEKTRISSNMPFINYTLYSVDISESSPKNREAFLRAIEDHNKIATILQTGLKELNLEGDIIWVKKVRCYMIQYY